MQTGNLKKRHESEGEQGSVYGRAWREEKKSFLKNKKRFLV